MKIEFIDNLNFTIYLNKLYTNRIDLKKKDDLEDYFKNLFLKMKDLYDMPLSGYYIITIYLDKQYGGIIDITKEDLEYIDYFGGQIDMRIAILDNIFLYQVKDIDSLKQQIPYGIIYQYKNNFYLELKKQIPDALYLDLLEWSNIVYKENTEIIRKKGKKIKKEEYL